LSPARSSKTWSSKIAGKIHPKGKHVLIARHFSTEHQSNPPSTIKLSRGRIEIRYKISQCIIAIPLFYDGHSCILSHGFPPCHVSPVGSQDEARLDMTASNGGMQ